LACGWPTLTLPLLWCSLFAASAATVWLGPWAERYFGRKDASAFVLDEVAGLWLTLCLFPRDVAPWIALAWAFPITRLCDIVKLPPARQLERLPQGWGVLLDDLASSLHAALLLWLLAWLLPALFPVAR
jgi:phosphatidylglycerophosphatase A